MNTVLEQTFRQLLLSHTAEELVTDLLRSENRSDEIRHAQYLSLITTLISLPSHNANWTILFHLDEESDDPAEHYEDIAAVRGQRSEYFNIDYVFFSIIDANIELEDAIAKNAPSTRDLAIKVLGRLGTNNNIYTLAEARRFADDFGTGAFHRDMFTLLNNC